MKDLLEGIEFLGIPTVVAIILVGIYFIIDFKSKILPEMISLKRYFEKRKQKKEDAIKEQQKQKELLEKLEARLASFEQRYSSDNIAKRDEWMGDVDSDRDWMHQRADIYDQSIIEIKDSLHEAASQLHSNTKMTEDMFVESSRDRIINFAEKAVDYDILLSREQFRRIDRVYQDYERFLEERGRQNGEVDSAYETIQDGYKYRLQHHSFLEDIKGYKIK